MTSLRHGNVVAMGADWIWPCFTTSSTSLQHPLQPTQPSWLHSAKSFKSVYGCMACRSEISLPKLEILLNDAWIDHNGKQFTALDATMTSTSSVVYLGTVLNASGRATAAVDRAIARGWIGYHTRR
eukprot:4078251-Amphidinium_carterae.2